ncbi:MAG: pseudouridine synthase [Coriobacteriales bacterium]|jgi:23S rRNA pseudouridine2605 synthase
MTDDARRDPHDYPMRLQKFLARAGVASRRGSENLMTAGRVTVNGAVVTELGAKVDPLVDKVAVDGIEVVWGSKPVVILLNKPAGYVSTMSDPHARHTVAELVPVKEYPGLFPIGRLDMDTTGVLLFTTDGELGHQLLGPRHKVPKVYEARVVGRLTAGDARRLEQGIELEDGPTLPARVQLLASGPWDVRMTLTEGRKRQVKRMLEAVGHPVKKLHRRAFGPITLAGLPEGSWRELNADEEQALRDAIQ